jgi:hypothetical protein
VEIVADKVRHLAMRAAGGEAKKTAVLIEKIFTTPFKGVT